jgi:hypothetical protein
VPGIFAQVVEATFVILGIAGKPAIDAYRIPLFIALGASTFVGHVGAGFVSDVNVSALLLMTLTHKVWYSWKF